MKQRTLVLLLIGWCLLFLRCETTEKSMVRAVCLAQAGERWQVVLFYQAPDAAADAAEASAALGICTAEGNSAEEARRAAEKFLPQRADYRLCDYLLFPAESDSSLLEQYEQDVLAQQCGRTAARMIGTGFDPTEFCAAAEENEALPDKLLEKLKTSAPLLPRLYQRGESFLLPVLELGEDGFFLADTSQLRSLQGNRTLDAAQSEMVRLLTGTGGARSFCLAGQQVEIRRCTVSVTVRQDSVRLRLDCQKRYGSRTPETDFCRQLEQLCCATVRSLWEQGVDVLYLQQAIALRYGAKDTICPTKNACPRLEADVRFLQF